MSKSKYKYRNGQAVKVKQYLEGGHVYQMQSGPGYASTYATYSIRTNWAGKIVHISHKANGKYKIIEDGKCNYFVDEMFEPLTPLTCKSLL